MEITITTGQEIARNGVLDSGIITSDEADEIYNLI
jgi:hypothetical protein